MFEPVTLNKTNSSNASQHKANQSFFAPVIQTKLTVNEPGDAFEQQADAMADKVMRRGTGNDKSFFIPPVIQRNCAGCEDEEEKKLQRKEGTGNVQVGSSTENYISSLNGNGKNLSPAERSFFEPKFGYDFSNVKIHADTKANQSAKEVNALAYTHGNNIVFGNNKYQPSTTEGKKLVAHELTHVIQQSSNTPAIQRDNSSLTPDELNLSNVFISSEVQLIPPGLLHTAVGPEGNLSAGNTSAPRVNVIIGQGMTLHRLGEIMLPLWNNATPFTAPGSSAPVTFAPLTADEMAKGLFIYNQQILGSSLSNWQAGLRFPLPVFINEATHTGILHPLNITERAAFFDVNNLALLTQQAIAATVESHSTPITGDQSHARQTAAQDFLSRYPENETRGIRLFVLSLANARQVRELVRRVLGDTPDRVAFDIALAFMNHAVNNEITVLKNQRDGMEILGLIEMFLTMETYTDLDTAAQQNLARALRMLQNLPQSAIDLPATPPACASGGRTITVDIVKLYGSSRDVMTDLLSANNIYKNCCVQFVLNSYNTVDEATTRQWLGGDMDMHSVRSCSSPHPEERTMNREARAMFNLSGHIKAFYVDTFTGQAANVIGFAYPQFCGPASGFLNTLVVRNNANIYTLAHEMGHIVLNAGHWAAADNLMNSVPTDGVLTAGQCRTGFAHAR